MSSTDETADTASIGPTSPSSTTTPRKRGGGATTNASARKSQKVGSATISDTPPDTVSDLMAMMLEKHVGGRLIVTLQKCLDQNRDAPATVVSACEDLVARVDETVYDLPLLNRDVDAFDVSYLSTEEHAFADELHAPVGTVNTQQCVEALTKLNEVQVHGVRPCLHPIAHF